MSTESQEILKRALALPDAEKAQVADELFSSLGEIDQAIDSAWRHEVEDRVAAYEAGNLKSVSLEENPHVETAVDSLITTVVGS